MSNSTTTTASVEQQLPQGIQGTDPVALVWVFPEHRVTRLSDDRLVIGRSSECGEILSGEGISRQHAQIVRDGPIFVLKDLESKNGTFLNGAPITENVLERQDVVRIGNWVGVVASIGRNETRAIEEISPGVFAGATLRQRIAQARRAATSTLPVILIGETGTGKEVIARYIHGCSERSGELVAINCAALPQALAEAELFGHQKGAFTGADRARVGLFRQADKGTLLLDEIQELSLETQAKLLRALQEKAVTPLGESRPVSVDVRIIAAAQSSLEAAVAQRKFRGDLYARLAGVEITLPSLRERREEIAAIFSATLQDELRSGAPQIDVALIERLCLYDWPFNVRELIQVTRQIAVLHGHEPPFVQSHLPDRVLQTKSATPEAATPETESTGGGARNANTGRREQAQVANDRQLEKLVSALREHSGNVSKAATALGISRQRAYRLMDLRPDLDIAEVRHPAD